MQYATNLRNLNLGQNRFTDLSPLTKLGKLNDLGLASNRQITDFGPIAELGSLTSLSLYNTGIEDVTPLSGLENLESLYIGLNRGLLDTSPLYPLLEANGGNLSRVAGITVTEHPPWDVNEDGAVDADGFGTRGGRHWNRVVMISSILGQTSTAMPPLMPMT